MLFRKICIAIRRLIDEQNANEADGLYALEIYVTLDYAFLAKLSDSIICFSGYFLKGVPKRKFLDDVERGEVELLL